MSEKTVVDPATLGDLFGKDVRARIEKAVKGPGETQRLRLPRRILWWLTSPRVMATVDEFMKVPIHAGVAEAWVKLPRVRKEAKRYRDTPPDEPVDFELPWNHRITLKRGRVIHATLEGQQIGALEFDITLALTIGRAILTIQDGCLVAARPPTCRAKGSFRCTISKEGLRPLTIPEDPKKPIQKTHEWKAPFVIPIRPGLRILPSRHERKPESDPESNGDPESSVDPEPSREPQPDGSPGSAPTSVDEEDLDKGEAGSTPDDSRWDSPWA